MISTTVKPYFSVVIITASGGVISRTHGTDLDAAIARAKERRVDFPDAKMVRVVRESADGQGVMASF